MSFSGPFGLLLNLSLTRWRQEMRVTISTFWAPVAGMATLEPRHVGMDRLVLEPKMCWLGRSVDQVSDICWNYIASGAVHICHRRWDIYIWVILLTTCLSVQVPNLSKKKVFLFNYWNCTFGIISVELYCLEVLIVKRNAEYILALLWIRSFNESSIKDTPLCLFRY